MKVTDQRTEVRNVAFSSVKVGNAFCHSERTHLKVDTRHGYDFLFRKKIWFRDRDMVQPANVVELVVGDWV